MQLTVTASKATAVAGAAHVGTDAGIVTSETTITTGAGANYTLTVGCQQCTPNSLVMASATNGTNTGGAPGIASVTPGDGKVTILVNNTDGANAFNGSVVVSFIVFN
jgi:hypothetical protein